MLANQLSCHHSSVAFTYKQILKEVELGKVNVDAVEVEDKLQM